MSDSLEQYLDDVRKSMEVMHPNIARYPDIAAMVVQETAYGMWRKNRVYDRVEVIFGALMPDGKPGYTIRWHDQRQAGRVTSIGLTEAEFRELVDKGNTMLGNGS
ncbi:MAG TPA: hypothetical protein VKU80_06005 [Planctomycetota bacterium]|nr:hypothetical protein [Planctomycetota bacterium]